MDDWLDIPKDRKRLPVGRLCLIMGLTVLLLLAVAGRNKVVSMGIEAVRSVFV